MKINYIPAFGRLIQRLPGIRLVAVIALPIIAAVATISTVIPMRAELAANPTEVTRVPVVFSGGYETDPRDNGRPVALIAAALGVPRELFRSAFSQVHPADPQFGPTGDEARQNKSVLMNRFGRHGVTNERLDAVSDFYRYNRGRNELWRHQSAAAFALVKNGAIIGFEITKGGFGYTSPPTVSVTGFTNLHANVQLSFGKVMERNGSIGAITTGRMDSDNGPRVK